MAAVVAGQVLRMTPTEEERTARDLQELLERLPPGAPFTTAQALAAGATYGALRSMVAAGLLVRPVRGVYHAASLQDSTSLRVEVLKLSTPPGAVVTDRSAAWVLGAERVLAPGAHLEVPQVSVYCRPGNRLRNKLVDSGQRLLSTADVVDVGGLLVTTPLRTACDVGRLLHRDQAIGVMDALGAVGGFSLGALVAEVGRFKGFRGVVQLRALAPLVDPRSGSPGEGTLRLRWHDVGLPWPECQVRVPGRFGGSYFIDIGLPALRLGAEYFGEEFHGPDQDRHDAHRLEWLREELDWVIVVARRDNVYGFHQDVDGLLAAAARRVGLNLC